jgi:hypothetical protein
VTLSPGTSPGQYVQTESYPSTHGSQAEHETFSSSGVKVTSLQTTSPSGTASYTFATPLPVILAPYVAGHSWDVTSTGTSTTGSDTVHETDRIVGIKNITVAGRRLPVLEVAIHHVITESTPSGTVASQTSTGTEYFAPSLGVFVAGSSSEVTQGTTVTNQFRLVSIGTPGTGTAPSGTGSIPSGTGSTPSGGATQGTPTASGPPVITRQPSNATCSLHGSASFSVTATGAPPLHYTWQQEVGDTPTWNDIPGATAMGWTQECTANARLRVVVSNAAGSATSYVVDLTVE